MAHTVRFLMDKQAGYLMCGNRVGCCGGSVSGMVKAFFSHACACCPTVQQTLKDMYALRLDDGWVLSGIYQFRNYQFRNGISGSVYMMGLMYDGNAQLNAQYCL